jgi:hypothetical protein
VILVGIIIATVLFTIVAFNTPWPGRLLWVILLGVLTPFFPPAGIPAVLFICHKAIVEVARLGR